MGNECCDAESPISACNLTAAFDGSGQQPAPTAADLVATVHKLQKVISSTPLLNLQAFCGPTPLSDEIENEIREEPIKYLASYLPTLEEILSECQTDNFHRGHLDAISKVWSPEHAQRIQFAVAMS